MVSNMAGPTPAGQKKLGHRSKDEPNRTKRTAGRTDGFGANQSVTRYPDEESANAETKTGRDSGFTTNRSSDRVSDDSEVELINVEEVGDVRHVGAREIE